MTYTFAHAGPGRVVCHGDPPLTLRVGETDYPCADPLAEWCEVTPDWVLHQGTQTLVCVNGAGASEPQVVEVPEVGLLLGLLVCLVITKLCTLPR